jgi:hypothetical protein
MSSLGELTPDCHHELKLVNIPFVRRRQALPMARDGTLRLCSNGLAAIASGQQSKRASTGPIIVGLPSGITCGLDRFLG